MDQCGTGRYRETHNIGVGSKKREDRRQFRKDGLFDDSMARRPEGWRDDNPARTAANDNRAPRRKCAPIRITRPLVG